MPAGMRHGCSLQGRISERMPADVGTAGMCAAMFGFFFAEGGPLTSFEDVVERADSKKFAQWHRGMLEHGVYLAPSMYEVLSYPVLEGCACKSGLGCKSGLPWLDSCHHLGNWDQMQSRAMYLLRECCWLHDGTLEKSSPLSCASLSGLPYSGRSYCNSQQGQRGLSPEVAKSEAHLFRFNRVLFIGRCIPQAGFTSLKHTEEVVDNTIAAARAVMKDIAK